MRYIVHILVRYCTSATINHGLLVSVRRARAGYTRYSAYFKFKCSTCTCGLLAAQSVWNVVWRPRPRTLRARARSFDFRKSQCTAACSQTRCHVHFAVTHLSMNFLRWNAPHRFFYSILFPTTFSYSHPIYWKESLRKTWGHMGIFWANFAKIAYVCRNKLYTSEPVNCHWICCYVTKTIQFRKINLKTFGKICPKFAHMTPCFSEWFFLIERVAIREVVGNRML